MGLKWLYGTAFTNDAAEECSRDHHLGAYSRMHQLSSMLERVQKSTNVYGAQKQQKCMCPHMIVHVAVPGPQIF